MPQGSQAGVRPSAGQGVQTGQNIQITSLKSLRLRDLLTFGYLWLPYWALLGLTWPYLALLGLTGPYMALLGALLGLTGLFLHLMTD